MLQDLSNRDRVSALDPVACRYELDRRLRVEEDFDAKTLVCVVIALRVLQRLQNMPSRLVVEKVQK